MAMRWLARREHGRAELQRKLAAKGFDDDAIREALAQASREGWLNERRFAESFLRARLARGETPWLAAQRARERGVEGAALDAALAEVEAAFDADAACRALIARRDPHRLRHRDERAWQRLARFLRNKGFDAATILRCLNEQAEDTGEDFGD